jgi:type IV pilus assembly protein PilC
MSRALSRPLTSALREQSIITLSLKRRLHPKFTWQYAITHRQMHHFVRQLATMISAGIPLLNCFDIASTANRQSNMRQMLKNIGSDLAGGEALSRAMTKYPQQFDPLFCQLVHNGEISGTLGSVLQLKKAMTYPIRVMILSVAVTLLLLITVVPKFAANFADFDAQLPPATVALIAASNFVVDYAATLVVALTLIIIMTRYALQRIQTLRHFKDRQLLRTPLIGPVVQKLATARLSRTLAATIASHLPIVDALQAAAQCTGNQAYNAAVKVAEKRLIAGDSLSRAFADEPLFPAVLQQYVAIGEQCGALEQILNAAAIQFEEDLDNTIQRFIDLLEPAIMVVLALLIGAIILALYMPIFELGAVI